MTTVRRGPPPPAGPEHPALMLNGPKGALIAVINLHERSAACRRTQLPGRWSGGGYVCVAQRALMMDPSFPCAVSLATVLPSDAERPSV